MTEAQRRQLDDLLQMERGLTAWEVEFIDRLDRADRRAALTLTLKQATALGRIHAQRILEHPGEGR